MKPGYYESKRGKVHQLLSFGPIVTVISNSGKEYQYDQLHYLNLCKDYRVIPSPKHSISYMIDEYYDQMGTIIA